MTRLIATGEASRIAFIVVIDLAFCGFLRFGSLARARGRCDCSGVLRISFENSGAACATDRDRTSAPTSSQWLIA